MQIPEKKQWEGGNNVKKSETMQKFIYIGCLQNHPFIMEAEFV